MRKWLICFVILLISLPLSACNNDNTAAPSTTTPNTTAPNTTNGAGNQSGAGGIEEHKFKLSYSGTEQGIDATGVNRFVELIKEQSNGKTTVTSFSSAQLAGGNMQRQLELLMQGGAFELACLSDQVLASAAPSMNILGTPFAFSSYEEVYKYCDSTGGEWMDAELNKIGLKYLGSLSNGLVHMTNSKREIITPDDVRGLKFRVFGEVQMKMMSLLGADPINMSWSEVYSAMQQGTIDGHLNGWTSITSGNIHEVQKYITKLNVNWGGFHFVMNLNEWNSLNAETQEAIANACHEAAVYARNVLDENEVSLEEMCVEDFGCVVTELTADEIAAFKSALEPLRKEVIENCGEEAAKAWGIL